MPHNIFMVKGYQKNLIDIQTKEIWFEAKMGSAPRGRRNTWAVRRPLKSIRRTKRRLPDRLFGVENAQR